MLNTTYILVDILDKAILRGGAIGALITGILLSVLTQWGMIRFYWIMVKEIFTVFSIVVGSMLSGWNDNAISMTAMQGLKAIHNPLYTTNRMMIFIGIFFEIVSLSGVIVISVFKPWGQRKHTSQRGSQKTGKSASSRTLVESTK
jgi:hypothetical protein